MATLECTGRDLTVCCFCTVPGGYVCNDSTLFGQHVKELPSATSDLLMIGLHRCLGAVMV